MDDDARRDGRMGLLPLADYQQRQRTSNPALHGPRLHRPVRRLQLGNGNRPWATLDSRRPVLLRLVHHLLRQKATSMTPAPGPLVRGLPLAPPGPCMLLSPIQMETLVAILPYIEITLSLLLIIGIVLQQRGAGLGGAFGGDNYASTFYKRRGAEKFLFNATIVLAVLFVASAIAGFLI